MDTNTYTFYAPCSSLDIEAMQTWLEDMALDGYLLKKCSRATHRYQFYKIEPLKIRYRLTPVSDSMEEWNMRPDEEHSTLAEAFGWEYVCSNNYFHIYRTYDEEAREIHTDPAVQAESIRQLGRRILTTAAIWWSLPLIYIFLLLAFGSPYAFWRSLIVDRAGAQFMMVVLIVLALIRASAIIIRLHAIKKKLKQGFVPIHRKEWKPKAKLYRIWCRVRPVVIVLMATILFMGRGAIAVKTDYQDNPDRTAERPFMTVTNMVADTDGASIKTVELSWMRNWAHVLSPVNYEWVEILTVADKDGAEGMVSIDLNYHETGSQFLSDRLTREYISYGEGFGTAMESAPEIKANMAYFYYNEYDNPCAVMQYGKTVVMVEFPRTDLDIPTLKFEYWIETMDKIFQH